MITNTIDVRKAVFRVSIVLLIKNLLPTKVRQLPIYRNFNSSKRSYMCKNQTKISIAMEQTVNIITHY